MNKLLTAAETARRLGLSEHEVARLVVRGELPALWIGGEVLRFHPDDVAAWRPRQVPQNAAQPSAPRSPVITVQEPPVPRSAESRDGPSLRAPPEGGSLRSPVSRGKGAVTTVSSQPMPPRARSWQDRCLEFVYTYDGYVVSALLVATILIALFVAPR